MPRFTTNNVWPPLQVVVGSAVLLVSSLDGAFAGEGLRTGPQVQAAVQNLRSATTGLLSRKHPGESEPICDGQDARTEPRKLQTIQLGTSSKTIRETAVARLPFDKLTDQQRDRVEQLLESESLYRRLPSLLLPVDHRAYLFFVEHPDLAVSIWRVMKVSKCQMRQISPNSYEMDVGDGSTGVMEILYRSANQTLLMCDGVFTGSLVVKPFAAKAIIHLQSHLAQSADGEPYVAHTADLFVSFPSHTVEMAAKFISPISNLIIDRNFSQISMFLQMMSRAMQKQPGWVEQVADRLDGVLPLRKQELLKVSARVYIAQRKRELTACKDSGSITLDDIMTPLREAENRRKPTVAASTIDQSDPTTVLQDSGTTSVGKTESPNLRTRTADKTNLTAAPM